MQKEEYSYYTQQFSKFGGLRPFTQTDAALIPSSNQGLTINKKDYKKWAYKRTILGQSKY